MAISALLVAILALALGGVSLYLAYTALMLADAATKLAEAATGLNKLTLSLNNESLTLTTLLLGGLEDARPGSARLICEALKEMPSPAEPEAQDLRAAIVSAMEDVASQPGGVLQHLGILFPKFRMLIDLALLQSKKK